MNTVQMLIPGLWYYIEGSEKPFYVGSVQNQTALLLRKHNDKYTDSTHKIFADLQGIELDEDILVENFGFLTACREGYVYKELYKKIEVLRGDNMELVKPATNLFVESTGGKRVTVYLECGSNKIYLSEISFVHELQLLIYSHTYVFPFINIDKLKNHAESTTTGSAE